MKKSLLSTLIVVISILTSQAQHCYKALETKYGVNTSANTSIETFKPRTSELDLVFKKIRGDAHVEIKIYVDNTLTWTHNFFDGNYTHATSEDGIIMQRIDNLQNKKIRV